MSNSKIEEAVIANQTKFLRKFKKVVNDGHLASPEQNLVDLSPDSNIWEKIKGEIGKGAGNELTDSERVPAKFRAVQSSAALCVNNFAPFKEHCENPKLSFLGYSGFGKPHGEPQFEKIFATGISNPHLDFYLENDTTIIAIESKFVEHTRNPEPPNHDNNLQPYRRDWEMLKGYLSDDFRKEIIEYYSNDNKPQRLNVAQLIKHTIGLLKQEKEAILVYLYWEPQNPTIDNLFAEHRHNIEMFKHRIEHFIEFVPLSYPEFWKLYKNDDLLKGHIGRVRERYEFKIEF